MSCALVTVVQTCALPILLFAKQLLTETSLPITGVALAAGFGSVRRFNTTFKEAYRMAPRDLRRRPAARYAHAGEHLPLRLGYRPPYDLESLLGFLRGRALPGVEPVGPPALQPGKQPVGEES